MILPFDPIPQRPMRKPLFLTSLLLSVSLASCSTILNNLPGVYKIDVQQGNIIDQAMIDQLRPNMSKRQVLYILGSPMMADVFHESRWDYLYSSSIHGGDRTQKRVSLMFKDDQLAGVQGDFKPSSLPVLKPSDEQTLELPKRELDKTLWQMITGIFGYGDSDEAPKAKRHEADNMIISPQNDSEKR